MGKSKENRMVGKVPDESTIEKTYLPSAEIKTPEGEALQDSTRQGSGLPFPAGEVISARLRSRRLQPEARFFLPALHLPPVRDRQGVYRVPKRTAICISLSNGLKVHGIFGCRLAAFRPSPLPR
jgi:hypothetical protein